MITIIKNVPFEVPKCSLFFNYSDTLPEYIELTNDKGKVFYFRYIDNKNNLKININRAGKYTANFSASNVIVKPLTIVNCVNKLPEKERNHAQEVTIKSADLEHTPARIYAKLGVIQYDREKFKTLPIPSKVFILLHEIGHLYYKTEWKTDLFAMYHFTRLGYNASNAFYTLSQILDGTKQQGAQRINNLYNAILHQTT